MSHNGTGTHQPMSVPLDLALMIRVADDNEGNGERVENGVNNGPRSLTTDLIGATLPKDKDEEDEEYDDFEVVTAKMEQKPSTTGEAISSERLEEVLKSIQTDEDMFDLQKIRDNIDAKEKEKKKTFSAHDELRNTLRAMAEIARIDYPEPQYVVYANDYIEELQFYIEM